MSLLSTHETYILLMLMVIRVGENGVSKPMINGVVYFSMVSNGLEAMVCKRWGGKEYSAMIINIDVNCNRKDGGW